MTLKTLLLVTVAGCATLAALPSAAQTADTTRSAPSFFKRGTTVNNAAIANERAPGEAEELAPDTRQTATGGPSGGYGRGGASGGS